MSNLEANVPSNESDHTVAQRREHMMEKWMRYQSNLSSTITFTLFRYIFKHGDLDGDGQLDFKVGVTLMSMNMFVIMHDQGDGAPCQDQQGES